MGDNEIQPIGWSVIPTIHKLYDIMARCTEFSTIRLPQVAMVGGQSSGKSSVLEALVGRDFLPRGFGICTRRPLLLMLQNQQLIPGGDGREWGEFESVPGKKFYDFLEIRKQIQAETEKEAGVNKRVSDNPIKLLISSPHVLNMTLVDLPGVTKVPLEDQPHDIEARIREMIMMHIKDTNCIILAVSPANGDLANSDALKMAKEADPSGSHTIGVITKLDLMDRGTNACDFLLGKVVPLELGYVGTVNRSQKDTDENQSIQEALKNEKFFIDNPVYNHLSDRCGIPQLSRKLNRILEQHVRTVIPGLKNELNSRKLVALQDLQTCGDFLESKAKQGEMLLKTLAEYCEVFNLTVVAKSEETLTGELMLGATIQNIFNSFFERSLEELNPLENLSNEAIRRAIQNACGSKASLFVSTLPFEAFVRSQIALFVDPSLKCVQLVYDALLEGTLAYATELQRFPELRKRLNGVLRKFLHDCLKSATTSITYFINIQMGHINMGHHNFIGWDKAIQLAVQELISSQMGHINMGTIIL